MIATISSDPFDRYKGVNPPEERKERKSVPDSALEGAVRAYERIIQFDDELFNKQPILDQDRGAVWRVLLKRFATTILSPEQINALLQRGVTYDKDEIHYCLFMYFTNRMIQNSYNAGHNGFTLNTRSLSKEQSDLCSELVGNQLANPLVIKVEGDGGHTFAYNIKSAIVELNGNASACARYAWNSQFKIKGNVSGVFAKNSVNSGFEVYGNVEQCGAESENSVFVVHGDVGGACGFTSKNSSFEIDGNVGDACGGDSIRSRFKIGGSVGKGCGDGAQGGEFNIQGDAEEKLGYNSKNCKFNIFGRVDKNWGLGAVNSEFRFHGDFSTDTMLSKGTIMVYTPEQYRKLLSLLPRRTLRQRLRLAEKHGIKAVLLDSEGKPLEERVI